MKIAINAPDEHQFSVMQRILDGRLTIESPDEFAEILEIYPDDPFLYRKYADLLGRLGRTQEAVPSYQRTADLFIDHGMHLQAIVAKILQWRLAKPDRRQVRTFHGQLQATGGRHTPLQRFWAALDLPELVALMQRLVRKRFASGRRIVQADQPADALFFVVDGTVAEMPSPECQSEAERAGVEVEPTLLGTNDIFGEVFPLDQATENANEILAVSQVELVKIPKSALTAICAVHQRVQTLLEMLYKADPSAHCERSWQTVRRATRCKLPARVDIASPPNRADTRSWYHDGMAVDISIGGICVHLDADEEALPDLKGRLVKLNLEFPDALLSNLSGKIVWQGRKGGGTASPAALIGIRFDTLNIVDRDHIADHIKNHLA